MRATGKKKQKILKFPESELLDLGGQIFWFSNSMETIVQSFD